MTNNECITAFHDLRLAAEAAVVVKVAELTTETNTLVERALAGPLPPANDEECEQQFINNLERLQAIQQTIAAPIVYP